MTDWLIVSVAVLAVAFVVTALSSTVQGTIGFGFAVLSVPVLSLLDTRLAPVPQLLLALPISLWWYGVHGTRSDSAKWRGSSSGGCREPSSACCCSNW